MGLQKEGADDWTHTAEALRQSGWEKPMGWGLYIRENK